MAEAKICQRCGGPLETGFVIDHTYGTALPANWVPGKPQRNWWGKMKMTGVLPIEAYRCTDCGWLELFAMPPGE